MPEAILEMKNVTKSFGKRRSVRVLDHADFALEQNRITALMGVSGSGKSTLARLLLMLDTCDEGEILYRGRPVNMAKRRESLAFHRRVQYISQRPESFFDPMYRLRSSVMEAARIHRLEPAKASDRLSQLLEQVKINEAVLDRYPYQVSGGEIQRVALCRALLPEPDVLILDECTSMLDVSVQAQILNLLRDLQKEWNLTYLFIAHDIEVVRWFTDRAVLLSEGKIREMNLHNADGSLFGCG